MRSLIRRFNPQVLAWVYAVCAYLGSILTRDHYTVDVAVAIYTAILLAAAFRSEIYDAFRAPVKSKHAGGAAAAADVNVLLTKATVSSPAAPRASALAGGGASPQLSPHLLTTTARTGISPISAAEVNRFEHKKGASPQPDGSRRRLRAIQSDAEDEDESTH